MIAPRKEWRAHCTRPATTAAAAQLIGSGDSGADRSVAPLFEPRIKGARLNWKKAACASSCPPAEERLKALPERIIARAADEEDRRRDFLLRVLLTDGSHSLLSSASKTSSFAVCYLVEVDCGNVWSRMRWEPEQLPAVLLCIGELCFIDSDDVLRLLFITACGLVTACQVLARKAGTGTALTPDVLAHWRAHKERRRLPCYTAEELPSIQTSCACSVQNGSRTSHQELAVGVLRVCSPPKKAPGASGQLRGVDPSLSGGRQCSASAVRICCGIGRPPHSATMGGTMVGNHGATVWGKHSSVAGPSSSLNSPTLNRPMSHPFLNEAAPYHYNFCSCA
ncbi:uncharacterized protein [Dermacentor albipictus]|uniref:uncharacterized protein isoform X2 n=1 Tax=Dermacentor albipictus TaxID=60249 RepID=UPI0038FC0758